MSERYRPITNFIREISVEPKISPQQAFTPKPSQETIVIERFKDEEEDGDPRTVGPVIFSPQRSSFMRTYLNSDPVIKRQQLIDFGVLPPKPEKTPQQRIEKMGYELVEEIRTTALMATPTSQGSNLKIGFILFPDVNGSALISSKEPDGLARIGEIMLGNGESTNDILKAFNQITHSVPKINDNYSVKAFTLPKSNSGETLFLFPDLHLAANVNEWGVFRTFNFDKRKGHSDIQTVGRIIDNARSQRTLTLS